MNGILLMDKLPGLTSARTLTRVKWHLPRGTKLGHAGTLDSFASGLLILLIGRPATRQSEKMMSWPKTYLTSIRLDMSSPTYDTDSTLQPIACSPPTLQNVQNALLRLTGVVQQVPPSFSALKVRGKRASDRYRDGEDVVLSPRPVHIYDIELTEYVWPLLKVRIECGRGTYIRAIARDLGKLLGTGGMLTELRRTRTGDFHVDQALPIDQISMENIKRLLRPMT